MSALAASVYSTAAIWTTALLSAGFGVSRHLGERRLEPPKFHFYQQTVFHMKAGILS